MPVPVVRTTVADVVEATLCDIFVTPDTPESVKVVPPPHDVPEPVKVSVIFPEFLAGIAAGETENDGSTMAVVALKRSVRHRQCSGRRSCCDHDCGRRCGDHRLRGLGCAGHTRDGKVRRAADPIRAEPGQGQCGPMESLA